MNIEVGQKYIANNKFTRICEVKAVSEQYVIVRYIGENKEYAIEKEIFLHGVKLYEEPTVRVVHIYLAENYNGYVHSFSSLIPWDENTKKQYVEAGFKFLSYVSVEMIDGEGV